MLLRQTAISASRLCFEFEQLVFPRESSAESADPILREDAMAGNNERERVGTAGLTNGPERAR